MIQQREVPCSLIKEYFKEIDKGKIYPKIEENAENVLAMRYYMGLYGGNKEKSFHELCTRVARVVSTAETIYNHEEKIYKAFRAKYL